MLLKKSLLGAIIGLISINSFAVSVNSSFDVKAVAIGGCSINAQDIVFGVISPAQSKEGAITQNGIVNLQCSKNTTVYLAQDNGFNQGHDNKLYLNGVKNDNDGEHFEYKLLKPAAFPNQVSGRIVYDGYQDHSIGDDSSHELQLVIQTSEQFRLDLRAIIEKGVITSNLKAGDYSDTINYTVRF